MRKPKVEMSGLRYGRLSIEETRRIADLFATMKDPTPGRIAKQMNRLPNTVGYFMLREGMLTTPPRTNPSVVVRKRRKCYPYDDATDALILALHAQGLSDAAVAREASGAFKIRRSRNSIHTRLMMLKHRPSSSGTAGVASSIASTARGEARRPPGAGDLPTFFSGVSP